MDQEPLLARTYRLLAGTNLSLPQIAGGAGVDVNWLMKLKQRRIPEPGVGKVQRVCDFLTAYEAIRVPRPTPDLVANS